MMTTTPDLQPTSVRGRARRGSALLLVVGVLALMSIVAIVALALGRTDARTGAAMAREKSIDRQIQQFAEYATGIIGADVHDAVTTPVGIIPSRFSGANAPVFRENTDYPSTDPKTVSNDVANHFKPSGINGTDPFLASVEPTFINPTLAAPSAEPWTDLKDWKQISLLAPDGRVINLHTLRGNFNAESGFGVDSAGNRRLSERAVVADPAGGLRLLSPAEVVIPANAVSNQYGGAAPAGDPLRLFDDVFYLPYTWADADGDGVYDSKWTEMVDATDPSQPVTLIADPAGLRLFYAVRVVDLSGLLNVNTASDLGRGPTDERPIGSTPSEVDLRRALMMVDVYDPSNFYTGGRGLDWLYAPNPREYEFSNYEDYDLGAALRLGGVGYDVANYYRTTGVALRPEQPIPAGYWGASLNAQQREQRFLSYTEGSKGYARVGGAVVHAARFGLADASELFESFGVNDPDTTSLMEVTFDAGKPMGIAADGRGPMRSGRDRTFERLTDLDRDGVLDSSTAQGDSNAALALQTNIRRILTPISASRPLTASVNLRDPVTGQVATSLTQRELGYDLIGRLEEIQTMLDDPALAGADPDVAAVSDPRTDNDFYNMTSEMFLAVLNTLSPFADRSLWTAPTPRKSVLSYGADMEFAFRTSGHWLANLIDAYDDDDVPTPFVLRAAEGGTTLTRAGYPNDANFPHPTLPRIDPSQPDYMFTADDRQKLAGSATDTSAGRVNIFGIERQPFLTEVLSITFYTDAPYDVTAPGSGGQTGDNEWEDYNPPPPLPQGPPVEPTVDGTRQLRNPDFLGQMVAFQLTNPFDKEIVLNRGYADPKPLPDFDGNGVPDPVFYIEYAGRRFQLAPIEVTGSGGIQLQSGMAPVVLAPGESRVFFATNPSSPIQFARRWQVVAASSANDDIADITGPGLQTFFDNLVTHHFGTPGTKAVHIAMFDKDNGQLLADNGLMADLHGENVAMTDDAARRSVYLWRVMRADTTSPSGGLEDLAGQKNKFENDLLVDRIRQPDGGASPVLASFLDESNLDINGLIAGNDTDSDPANDEDNSGVSIAVMGSIRRPNMPAGQTVPAGAIPPWCLEVVAGSTYAIGLNDSDLEPSAPGSAENSAGDWTRDFGAFLADVTDPAANRPTIASDPKDKIDNDIPSNQSGVSFARTAIELHLAGKDGSGNRINKGLFTRPTDLLLVLGIGPSSVPGTAVTAPAGYTEREATHTTLSEAMAMAMDYASPDATTGYRRIYAGVGSTSTTVPVGLGLTRPARKLDRGHLVIDDFVAFDDLNNNGVRDGSEIPLANGVPLAINMLSNFRVNDWGGLDTPVAGRVNINTAPLWVLRTLPFLTPNPNTNDYVAGTWGSLVPTTDNLTNPLRDGATTLINYRDQLSLIPKGRASLAFSPSFNPNVAGNAAFGPAPGRPRQAEIFSLRQNQGFSSIGEILAVRRPQAGLDVGDIDFLGHDDSALPNTDGLSPTQFQSPTSSGSTALVNDGLTDDYEEKLTVAGALLNSITVRSDVFAVWFVVQGYAPEDVEGLAPEDPMVPSVARRYMMIVDRSNVVDPTDTPRVLMFREVPL